MTREIHGIARILGTPSPELRKALERYGLPMYAAYQVLNP